MNTIKTSELPFNSLDICISGLTASGKTTHSHLLSGEFGFTYVSASQILLYLAGFNPIQKRDFWLSKEASCLWNDDMTIKVDSELIKLISPSSHIIFDSFSMPWRHSGSSLRIFLHSDIKSRVFKSIVSHRGQSKLAFKEYESAINQKDQILLESYNRLFGISFNQSWEQFDVVLDISSAIKEPSFASSQKSISLVHKCLHAIVIFALTKSKKDQYKYEQLKTRYSNLFIKDRLLM